MQTICVNNFTALYRKASSPKPFKIKHVIRVSEKETTPLNDATSEMAQEKVLDSDDQTVSSVEQRKTKGFILDEKKAEQTARKVAGTFAPRPSGQVKNPATPGNSFPCASATVQYISGTWLYDLFGIQAAIGAVAGGLLSFNVLFPSDHPDIAKLIGFAPFWDQL